MRQSMLIFVDNRIIPTTEFAIRVYAGDTSIGWGHDGRDSDWKIGIGLGKYFIIGGDFEFTINIIELIRQVRCECA